MKKTYVFLDPIEIEDVPTPLIYDAQNDAVEGFNTVLIKLDARTNSSLDWRKACERARYEIACGFKVFWELDLGLFDQLPMPLSDQTQYLALQLSFKHFRETIWPEFEPHTVGASLYRGDLDFSRGFAWDHVEQQENYTEWKKKFSEKMPDDYLRKLFCREVSLEYIQLLVRQLPGELITCVLLDAASIQDPLLLGELLAKERYGHLHRAVAEMCLPETALSMDPKGFLGSYILTSERINSISFGICLPENLSGESQAAFTKTIDHLQKFKLPFRFVSETTLTAEWNGLDALFVDNVSAAGRRRLQGFCAAGGTVVALGHPLGLVQEISFSDWVKDGVWS